MNTKDELMALIERAILLLDVLIAEKDYNKDTALKERTELERLTDDPQERLIELASKALDQTSPLYTLPNRKKMALSHFSQELRNGYTTVKFDV